MTVTPKKNTPVPAELTTPADSPPEPKPAEEPRVVGPALVSTMQPVTVVLAAHLHIGGADYAPGDKILVSADYARRLRGQGYTARSA
ncbi:hypothetical protein AB0O57_29400 [Streptomyces sp. NPDC091201]|uniref:hypothetical protein n=1 Tax=Streptomyces sp. NPDC091201 TaxID=3155190 RepID=UPI00344841AB